MHEWEAFCTAFTAWALAAGARASLTRTHGLAPGQIHLDGRAVRARFLTPGLARFVAWAARTPGELRDPEETHEQGEGEEPLKGESFLVDLCGPQDLCGDDASCAQPRVREEEVSEAGKRCGEAAAEGPEASAEACLWAAKPAMVILPMQVQAARRETDSDGRPTGFKQAALLEGKARYPEALADGVGDAGKTGAVVAPAAAVGADARPAEATAEWAACEGMAAVADSLAVQKAAEAMAGRQASKGTASVAADSGRGIPEEILAGRMASDKAQAAAGSGGTRRKLRQPAWVDVSEIG